MRVRRRTDADLRYILFAPDDITILTRIAVWASVQPGRADWVQLVIERPDASPPGYMRVVIDGPFDHRMPLAPRVDVRLDG